MAPPWIAGLSCGSPGGPSELRGRDRAGSPAVAPLRAADANDLTMDEGGEDALAPRAAPGGVAINQADVGPRGASHVLLYVRV
jgi:hypothetical protein